MKKTMLTKHQIETILKRRHEFVRSFQRSKILSSSAGEGDTSVKAYESVRDKYFPGMIRQSSVTVWDTDIFEAAIHSSDAFMPTDEETPLVFSYHYINPLPSYWVTNEKDDYARMIIESLYEKLEEGGVIEGVTDHFAKHENSILLSIFSCFIDMYGNVLSLDTPEDLYPNPDGTFTSVRAGVFCVEYQVMTGSIYDSIALVPVPIYIVDNNWVIRPDAYLSSRGADILSANHFLTRDSVQVSSSRESGKFKTQKGTEPIHRTAEFRTVSLRKKPGKPVGTGTGRKVGEDFCFPVRMHPRKFKTPLKDGRTMILIPESIKGNRDCPLRTRTVINHANRL